MNTLFILLQDATAAVGQQQGSSWTFWLIMLVIFVVFYFVLIHPFKKKKKEQQTQRASLQKGDKIVTSGGLYGVIKDVHGEAFVIDLSKGVTVTMDKKDLTLVEKGEEQLEDDEQTVLVCPNCKTSWRGDILFCPNCGSKLEKVCPKCHRSNLPKDATFCPDCGCEL